MLPGMTQKFRSSLRELLRGADLRRANLKVVRMSSLKSERKQWLDLVYVPSKVSTCIFLSMINKADPCNDVDANVSPRARQYATDDICPISDISIIYQASCICMMNTTGLDTEGPGRNKIWLVILL